MLIWLSVTLLVVSAVVHNFSGETSKGIFWAIMAILIILVKSVLGVE